MILGKGGMFQRTFNTIGKWSQERVYFLFNMQAFNWDSHLKHWILNMIVWHEMVREKGERKETSKVTFRDRIQGQDMTLDTCDLKTKG